MANRHPCPRRRAPGDGWGPQNRSRIGKCWRGKDGPPSLARNGEFPRASVVRSSIRTTPDAHERPIVRPRESATSCHTRIYRQPNLAVRIVVQQRTRRSIKLFSDQRVPSMNSILQKPDSRSTLCFVSLEFNVISLPCLIFFDFYRGTGFFGAGTWWILVCLLFVLLAMSLFTLPRRRSLAVSGLLVFALVTAAGFILPFLYPPPTKGYRADKLLHPNRRLSFRVRARRLTERWIRCQRPVPAAVGELMLGQDRYAHRKESALKRR